jgi:hypothetical protein
MNTKSRPKGVPNRIPQGLGQGIQKMNQMRLLQLAGETDFATVIRFDRVPSKLTA